MKTLDVKEKAAALGVDLIGFAPASRWRDLPAENNPASIMPACKTVIVVGRRILRGSMRGVEEGTNFGSTYGAYGHGWEEYQFLPRNLYNLGVFLENAGFEALPLNGGNLAAAGEGIALAQSGVKANVRLDDKLFAHLAGLGSVGKGGFFLTPKFGHRQHFGLILTDAELRDAEPVCDVSFCENCTACIDACPLHAISKNSSGEWVRDAKLCKACRNGAEGGGETFTEVRDRFAASCGRACLVALQNKTGNRFKEEFRKRSVWTRDLENKVTVTPLNAQGGK